MPVCLTACLLVSTQLLSPRICGLKSSIRHKANICVTRKKLNAIPSRRHTPVQDLNVDISNKIHNAHLFNVILTLDPFAAEAVASCLNMRKCSWNCIHREMITEHIGGTFKEQRDMYWLFSILTPDPKWQQVIGGCTLHIYEGGREPECEQLRCLFELPMSVGGGGGVHVSKVYIPFQC